MEKHFDVTITDDDLALERKIEQIDAECALHGIYVLRTNLDAAVLDSCSTVKAYKQLSKC
jgi:hypothetical protein